jgi:hypothetical protein
MTSTSRFAVLVGLPSLCAGAIWIAVLAVAGITGQHPIWTLQARNLSEAAAFRDGAAVVRRVEAREDLNRPEEVRARVVLPTAASLTPIEAAAATRERGMVQLLLDLGASPDADVWQRAYCISDSDEVRDLLAARRPSGARDDCAGR